MMNAGAMKPVMNETTAPILRGFHAGGGSSSDKENRKVGKRRPVITMP
jgi:hypothetical protein